MNWVKTNLTKNRLKTWIQILTLEKIIQHTVSAVLFLEVFLEYVPDIGPIIQVGNNFMYIANLFVAISFAAALHFTLQEKKNRLQAQ